MLKFSDIFLEPIRNILDSRTLRTFRDLTIRPGAFIDNYVNSASERSLYTHPVSYFLVAATLHWLDIQLLREFLLSAYGHAYELAGESDFEARAENSVWLLEVAGTYLTFPFLCIPYAVLLSIVGRVRSMADSIAFATYIVAHANLLASLLSPFSTKFGLTGYNSVSIALVLGYSIWAGGRFYGRPWGYIVPPILLVVAILANAYAAAAVNKIIYSF